jgi:hypothetical protein
MKVAAASWFHTAVTFFKSMDSTKM